MSDSPTQPSPESPTTAIPGPVKRSTRPKGIHTPLRTKAIYNADELAESVAITIASGKGFRSSPTLGPVTEYDRRTLSRIAQESVEEFNDRLALKLRLIADKATLRIEEKLDSDQFKTSELGFILSVAHDKRLSLDGSRALNNSSVNIQVNNFGSSPKASLLSELDGMTNVTPKPSDPLP